MTVWASVVRKYLAATMTRRSSPTPSAKVKKCPVGLRCKVMVTRPIHCLRFVVLARIPQKHHATPQKPVQSSQYIAGIVRIARIARIPRQCNHSHSRTTSYASGNTGAPRGYFCTFADARGACDLLPCLRFSILSEGLHSSLRRFLGAILTVIF